MARERTLFSGLVGACIEAWAELRIHRTRVLLSLIGVAVAVTALTSVVGLGAIAQQATIESAERSSGRPATLYLSAYSNTGTIDPDALETAFRTAVGRYKIDFASTVVYTTQRTQFVDGAVDVDTQLVDEPYGTMHRVQVDEGRWFDDGDLDRLAPALVVNSIFWQHLGSPDLRTHPTVTLLGDGKTTAVIVGVTEALPYVETPQMFMLPSSYYAIADPTTVAQLQPQFEVWVPTKLFEQLQTLLQRDVAGALGTDAQVDVYRQDYASTGEDPFGPTKLVIGGVAILVLLLGALGLVNISLVTVRQRIREIGIRRSFGATAGRVFFAVMMESVVATVVAGLVGVILAVLIVENPLVQQFVAFGITDLPPFPIEAALLGLAASAAVGAIAGLLPALVAVRVKVIDAIRY
ncbi:MAG: ABC transporter permease [Rhodoglobus sp.]